MTRGCTAWWSQGPVTVTGAWVWTEENLITGPMRQNCTGLCSGDLKVHRAMMCLLPAARNHTQLSSAHLTRTPPSPPHTSSFSCCHSHVTPVLDLVAWAVTSDWLISWGGHRRAPPSSSRLLPSANHHIFCHTHDTQHPAASQHSTFILRTPAVPQYPPVTSSASLPPDSWQLGQEASSLPLPIQEDRREHPQLLLSPGLNEKSSPGEHLGAATKGQVTMYRLAPTQQPETSREGGALSYPCFPRVRARQMDVS